MQFPILSWPDITTINTWAAVIGAVSALVYLIFAVYIHLKGTKKKSSLEEPPWRISRLDIDVWELERMNPKKAFIYGYSISYGYEADEEIELILRTPTTAFGRGTKIPFYTSENVNSNYSLNIFYRVPDKNSKAVKIEDFHGKIGRTAVPDDVKVWSVDLY